MAKITKLPGMKVISGFKGTLDFYVWKGLACVRRWPHSPGHRRAPLVEAQWSAFATASRLWTQLSPGVQDTYKRMAIPMGKSGRDLFTRGYLSGLYRYPTAGE